MRALVLSLMVAVLVACGGGLREYPRWRFAAGAPTEMASGCVLGRSFIRMSGKTGVGVTVELRSRGDCTVRFTRAELVVDGGTRAPATLPEAITLRGRSLVYVWLPFELDNDRAWNDGHRTGVFEIDLETNGVAAPTWRIAADHRRERRYTDGKPARLTRFNSDANAPGIVHLEAPPRENGDPALYVAPEDPGEHELYIGPGVVLGPASGRTPDDNDVELEGAVQVRVAYQPLTTSHRSRDLPFPRRGGWAMTLGWAPIQTDHSLDGALAWKRGPMYLEVERYWLNFSAGVGAVAYTDGWDGGVQLTLSAIPYGFRMRYLADGGFEFMGAFRIELPTAVTWSR